MSLGGVLALATFTSGIYSPDGSQIAFEKAESNRVTVGIMNVGGGRPVWTYSGPGNAAHPAWGAAGELYFTAGNDPLTAATGRGTEIGGYNLQCYRDGKVVSLTSGRHRDWSPFPDSDGTIWFVTDRGEEAGRIGELCRASLACLKGGRMTFPLQYGGANSGPGQPSVAPDGRLLLFAELTTFRGVWRVVVAPVDRPQDAVSLTPNTRYAYAPRFSPDGRLIAYAGFRAGDPDWMVFVQELRSGREAMVGRGKSPAFAPDGKTLLLVCDGQFRAVPVPGEFPLSAETVEPDLSRAFQLPPTVGDYGKLAVAVTDDRGELWELDARIPATSNRLEQAVGVYCGSELRLYCEGRLVAKTEPYGTFVKAGQQAKRGWPSSVPRPLTRANLFGGEHQ